MGTDENCPDHSFIVVSMLAQRRREWASIKSALGQRLMFADVAVIIVRFGDCFITGQSAQSRESR